MDWSEVDLKRLLNPKKIKMIKLLDEFPNLNQSNLSKLMGLSVRQTRRYLSILKDADLIKTKKLTQKGKPVIISLKKKKN